MRVMSADEWIDRSLDRSNAYGYTVPPRQQQQIKSPNQLLVGIVRAATTHSINAVWETIDIISQHDHHNPTTWGKKRRPVHITRFQGQKVCVMCI